MTKTSTKLITLFSLLMTTGIFYAKSQNLVSNPGFEIQDSCPAVSEITLAHPWHSATLGTPDLMNDTCSTQNFFGRTGHGSSGIYAMNTFADNREYLEAPLISPLVAGQRYDVSFWVKYTNYKYAVNRMGAYFSTTVINQTTTSYLAFTPQVDNPTSNMLSSPGWMQISGYFIAAGGESQILIGNFHPDSQTSTVIVNASSSSAVSFYQVDDVSVTAHVVGIDEPNTLGDLVLVYPSPASDQARIQFPASIKIKSVAVFDNLGRFVNTISILTNDQGEIILNLENCLSGIYCLSLETESAVIKKKIMVVK